MTASLSSLHRSSLERLIQDARRSIEDDLDETLEGTFGINADGRIEDEGDLSLSNAQSAVRADLVEIVEFLRSEGEDDAGSVARLIREAAFTHTNRLVAVRVAEAVGVLPETMGKGTASSGFRDFSELAPTVAETEWGRFAEFVRLCADELAADVPALFDPRSPLLELAMSETVLAEIVEAMSGLDDHVWGAPDALGWAYQFFNTGQERKEMRESSAPRNSRELAVRNQFFTPSYVVEFLVHNGLGAHLAAGFPALAGQLPLLVEVPTEQIDVDLEKVSVLDPACGSGHFLLGAYDVLEKAWQLAGVEPAQAAPAIVRSLWGIDIDPRATQIAQAAVMFRARRHCRGDKLPTANVICARALPVGPEVEDFIASLPAHVARAVKAIADELVDAPILGPLLKIEERLDREVRDLFGTGEIEGVLTPAPDAPAGNDIQPAVLAALSEIADSATSTAVQRLFAAEAHDAVRFVEAMSRQYSFTLANPPFGAGCLSTDDYLKATYPESWTELYACFIERCLELSTSMVGAITSSTFLTTRRLASYRQRLVDRGLEFVVDLGPGVLRGATVNTAIVVVGSGDACGYLDLRNSTMKPADLLTAIEAEDFESHNVSTFAALPNSPLAFHASRSVLDLWESNQTLDPIVARVRTGGKTFDNFRYVRAWWEVSSDALTRGWVWYEKGGEYQPYFAPTRLVVNWKNDGSELREYGERSGRIAQVLQSKAAYWGEPGLCFPRMSSIGFSARTMSAEEIFADTSVAIFPAREGEPAAVGLLGILNSTVVAEILGVFGRGRSTENNSVKSLPIHPNWTRDPEIVELTKSLIAEFRELEAAREVSPAFGATLEAIDPSQLRWSANRVRKLQEALDLRTSALFGLTRRVDEAITKRPDLNESLFVEEGHHDHDKRLVSFIVGTAMGRWSLCVDTSRSGQNPWGPRPAPVHVNNEADAVGILVDQPGAPDDITAKVETLCDRFDLGSAEHDAIVNFMDHSSLRRYLRTRFFAAHLKEYSGGGRKAPIYWQLQVPSKTWGLWIYAPKLSREMLFAIVRFTEQRQRLAKQQIGYLQREAETGGGGRKASEVAKELESEQKLAVELETFRAEAERIANLGWEPDLDDGMVLNAAPLADLFPAWKEAAKYRKELRAGKYEWATVARYADQL